METLVQTFTMGKTANITGVSSGDQGINNQWYPTKKGVCRYKEAGKGI